MQPVFDWDADNEAPIARYDVEPYEAEESMARNLHLLIRGIR